MLQSRLLESVPKRFISALGVALLFMIFVAQDQAHWWQLKPDYAFGWLVPFFVVYIVHARWSDLLRCLKAEGPSPLSAFQRRIFDFLAVLTLACGVLVFLLGALYRAGSGSTQPGSLALAAGLCGIVLGMVYLNTEPAGLQVRSRGSSTRTVDARLRTASLFAFPALIWLLSAPLASAIENAISLFLLQRVVAVVYTVFNFLGYTLIQEGNVLVLPLGKVGVADACSGIRSLTGCLFAGSFLAAVFLDGFWKKVALVGAALLLAFATNLLRSLFLTGWAYAYGSDAIEGPLHDNTGFAVLGLTVVGLFLLLPLFNAKNWARWLRLDVPPETEIPSERKLTHVDS